MLGVMALGAVIVAATPALAQDADAAGPVALVQQLTTALLAAMKSGTGTPFRSRFDMLAPVIENTFDLNRVLSLSVGPAWTNLPMEQKQALAKAFLRYTIATYAANFDSYNGQRLEVSPAVRAVGNGEQIVDTRIIRADGTSEAIDYVMRHDAGGWKAVDVLTGGGISRVAVQHADFGGFMSDGGAPALTVALRHKVSTLSGGALA
jgi:phospholipid transport system substrate-binding protein